MLPSINERKFKSRKKSYNVFFNKQRIGVATVTTNNHDANLFIKNGINGFYSNDSNELTDTLVFLCKNPDAAQRIGKEGRKTACDLFHIDRYLFEWQETIKEVIGKC